MLNPTDIRRALWPDDLPEYMKVWAILDGARDNRIYGAVDAYGGEKSCLYAGTLPWQLKMAAPYLVELERDDKFTDFVLRQGWGNSWGVFLHAGTSASRLRRHLRGFLRVRDEAGKKLIFRYYDPRVLRVYLPTCWTEELKAVYGPITRFLTEDQDGDAVLEFTFEEMRLVSRTIPASPGAALNRAV